MTLKKYFIFVLAILLIVSTPLSISAKKNETTNLKNSISVSVIDSMSSEVKTGITITELSLNDYLTNLVETSEDSNASFNLNKISKKDLSYFGQFNQDFLPTHIVTFKYSDSNGVITQTDKYYIFVEQVPVESEISPMAVDTIFDIGSFSLSLYEYNQNPSFWSGFWVVADGAAMVFPGIPAVSGVNRMIQDSPSVLKPALAKGVRPYSTLQNISAPSNYMGNGWERHHIFEKRFAGKLDTTEGKMLSIFIPKYNYHYQITQRMSKKIPWYEALFWTKDATLRAHTEAYGELWAESGFADEYWEFLYKFSQQHQYD
ncbi:hypothetical protein PGC35_06300 [Psychrobacillus sp. PGGUH221]|uniref:hypothetical protein n=1 Tax=Psychrobacillus sp. PGGUH221 TaxID=3020058 RepID=UPI0035C711B5